ncbi:hypothetical protein BG74_09470 [Sodalis-like endosymbiont of Proechinophthirus fluctus]|uniref:M66 family metalloprotease n=1 Tax=Sodalis-like endosymbiont of Proechinophthirus fluctus TaxID=1462730 RepID=UPI0007A844F9|nr:M66 family metalloprotease [Sodalis-like endosymbiont of Proechinophthirus fluctus]KYP95343.1 hypothetical protein BG74_09470 [Sodalis-like endosymbiont of Proechinophthirus fluctus]
MILLGIDNTKYGSFSLPGTGERNLSNRFVADQITAYNTVGNYGNGLQVHCGSGGAGIVTLDKSVGNELSNELCYDDSSIIQIILLALYTILLKILTLPGAG